MAILFTDGFDMYGPDGEGPLKDNWANHWEPSPRSGMPPDWATKSFPMPEAVLNRMTRAGWKPVLDQVTFNRWVYRKFNVAGRAIAEEGGDVWRRDLREAGF